MGKTYRRQPREDKRPRREDEVSASAAVERELQELKEDHIEDMKFLAEYDADFFDAEEHLKHATSFMETS